MQLKKRLKWTAIAHPKAVLYKFESTECDEVVIFSENEREHRTKNCSCRAIRLANITGNEQNLFILNEQSEHRLHVKIPENYFKKIISRKLFRPENYFASQLSSP